MSRHGVIMHCNYCGEPDHNIKGCKYLKAGLPPPNVQAPPAPEGDVEAATAQVPPNVEADPNVGDDEQVITQVCHLYCRFSCTVDSQKYCKDMIHNYLHFNRSTTLQKIMS